MSTRSSTDVRLASASSSGVLTKKLLRSMPVCLVSLSVGVALVVGCISLTLSRSGEMRRTEAMAVVGENIRDLGRTSTRVDRQVVFPIRNAGTRRLILNEIDLTCECGDRVLRTILIAPGETVDVMVQLDTRFAFGAVESTARFTTNDPTRPRFDLIVRAIVTQDAAVVANDRLKTTERDYGTPERQGAK